MKKNLYLLATGSLFLVAVFSSCKKNSSTEQTVVSVPPYQIGQPVSDAAPLSGSIKGTMLSGHNYIIGGDVTVNKGDTLLLQPNVNVCVNNASTIIVKGVFISLGTQATPNSISACSAAKINTIAQAESPSTDPAYNGGHGWWTGLECDTSCTLLVLKWTHIDFTGAAYAVTEPFVGGAQGGTAFGILFQNPKGDFIMEDSWMYGCIDDCIRIQHGRISLMRNTFEKCGYIGGDCLNAKSGTVGDMAYNMFIGTATNGTKASNKGGVAPQTNIVMYNNTYVNGGYRQAQTARCGAIDFEEGAKGMGYNNLMVNCKYSFRVMGPMPNAAGIPVADTANLFYGNNYAYGDSASVMDQIYPVGYVTHPNCFVVPTPSSTNYVLTNAASGSAAYDASALAGKNNPLFVNFPLPEPGITHLYDINYIGNYNFRLQAGSPALGKGTTSFSPLNACQVTVPNLKPSQTPPGVDIGCYQSNGNGNVH
ncbi:MAG TPA: hypothetical protein VNZ86_10805 [Bacteroidia bacterium]|jgi:hypothetical protein|nr:hypothetical protein [Bacteroidia bacterium]